MDSHRFRLAAVLAVSSAFLASCDRNDCKDTQGRPVPCHGGGGGHGGSGTAFGSGGSGGDSASGAVSRGGFGGSGGGDGGGGGE